MSRSDFLKNSNEFSQVLEIRRMANQYAEKTGGFVKGSYEGLLNSIIAGITREEFFYSYMSVPREDARRAVGRKFSALWQMLRSAFYKNISAEMGAAAEKNIHVLSILSNYAFIEHLFRYDCETFDELKKYRAEYPGDANVASMRRRAEEFYKKGHVREALDLFLRIVSSGCDDFTATIQAAMLLLFEEKNIGKAFEYLEKAASGAKIRSARAYAYVRVLMAFILRLEALSSGENERFLNARANIDEALKSSGDGFLTVKLADIECRAACEPVTNDFGAAPWRELTETIRSDRNYVFQVFMGHAFDRFAGHFEKYAEFLAESAGDEFREASAGFENVVAGARRAGGEARTFQAQKEYKALCKNMESRRTYFDFIEFTKKITGISDVLKDIAASAEVEAKFAGIKKELETIVLNYKNELAENLKPFSEKLSKLSKLKEKSDSISAEHASFAALAAGTRGDEAPGAARLKVKNLSMSAFWLVELILAASCFMSELIDFSYFFIASVLNVIMIRAYSSACISICVFILKERFSNIKKEISKLEFSLELNNKGPADAEFKTRDKYIKIISEKFDIDAIEARNVMDAAMAGNYKKVRKITC